MVSVLILSAVDHGFQPRSDQTKDYKIGIICCFSTKHTALRRKSKVFPKVFLLLQEIRADNTIKT